VKAYGYEFGRIVISSANLRSYLLNQQTWRYQWT